MWDRASLEQRCKQPTRCNSFRLLILLLIYLNLLYMFRATNSPIFRSAFDCIYNFWYSTMQSKVLLKMGEFVARNMYSRFKQINKNINKRKLLHLVGCLQSMFGVTNLESCWRMKDQLDVTCYFISLLLCSTTNWEQDDRCGNSSTQSQAPDDGYINVRNMLST